MGIRKLRCSFCRKTEDQISKLVAGPRLIVKRRAAFCASVSKRYGLPVPVDVSSGPEVATVRDLVAQFDACTSRARLQARHGT